MGEAACVIGEGVGVPLWWGGGETLAGRGVDLGGVG